MLRGDSAVPLTFSCRSTALKSGPPLSPIPAAEIQARVARTGQVSRCSPKGTATVRGPSPNISVLVCRNNIYRPCLGALNLTLPPVATLTVGTVY